MDRSLGWFCIHTFSKETQILHLLPYQTTRETYMLAIEEFFGDDGGEVSEHVNTMLCWLGLGGDGGFRVS